MGEPSVGKREQTLFEKIISDLKEHDQRAKAAAKACASAVGVAAIVGSNSNDSYYTGLTELFGQPEFRDWSRVVSMGSVLDKLDDQLMQLRRTVYTQPTILIGNDCPFGDALGSVIVTLPGNSLLALVGPIRMPYSETRNLLTAVVSAFN